ncbi:MAG: hypothetical protein WDW38_004965 [Sanguina aurantia]
MRMMWDDDWLWVGTWMEEPQLVAQLTVKNSVIYKDNDFEIFLDPDADNHNYYEFEANALNTTWELKLAKPYKDGGPAIDPCNLQGTACSVKLDGGINDPANPSRGWGMVVRLPLNELGTGYNREGRNPPQAGDYWRVNFSRVQWRYQVIEGVYEKMAGLPEDNWVWSPQGIIDMHRPEQWGYVVFRGQADSSTSSQPNLCIPDPAFEARRAVMQVYHLQRDYKAFYGRFAATLQQLGMVESVSTQAALDHTAATPASCHAALGEEHTAPAHQTEGEESELGLGSEHHATETQTGSKIEEAEETDWVMVDSAVGGAGDESPSGPDNDSSCPMSSPDFITPCATHSNHASSPMQDSASPSPSQPSCGALTQTHSTNDCDTPTLLGGRQLSVTDMTRLPLASGGLSFSDSSTLLPSSTPPHLGNSPAARAISSAGQNTADCVLVSSTQAPPQPQHQRHQHLQPQASQLQHPTHTDVTPPSATTPADAASSTSAAVPTLAHSVQPPSADTSGIALLTVEVGSAQHQEDHRQPPQGLAAAAASISIHTHSADPYQPQATVSDGGKHAPPAVTPRPPSSSPTAAHPPLPATNQAAPHPSQPGPAHVVAHGSSTAASAALGSGQPAPGSGNAASGAVPTGGSAVLLLSVSRLQGELSRSNAARDELSRKQGEYKGQIAKLEGQSNSRDRIIKQQAAELERLKASDVRMHAELSKAQLGLGVTPDRCRHTQQALQDQAERAALQVEGHEAEVCKLRALVASEAADVQDLQHFSDAERQVLLDAQGELRSALSSSQERFESVRGKYNAACSQMSDMESELFSLRGEVYKVRTQLVEAEVHSRTSHERLTVLEPQLALLTQQLAASTHARTGAEEDAELAREGSGKMLKQMRGILHALERHSTVLKGSELMPLLRQLTEWVASHQHDICNTDDTTMRLA